MTRQVQHDKLEQGVVRSLVKFEPVNEEELFLMFSLGRQNGPGIERDGRSSPWMSHPNPKWAHFHVTDPDLQRWGTWFLDRRSKDKDLEKLMLKIENYEKNIALNPNGFSPDYLEQLQDLQFQNENEAVYSDQFKKAYPNHQVIAIQGIGDLTMNHWNVGFLRSKFTNGHAEILHLLDEPIHDRVYSCLVKWLDRTPKYEIRDVRFNRYVFTTDRNDARVVQIDGEGVADQIEFAVYGQQVIKPKKTGVGGEVFEPSEIVHQFADVRHLFQLPNLKTPDGNPGYFFGKLQNDDIWFGEAELLDSRNLRRAALAGSIELNRLYQGLGASIEQVRSATRSSNTTYTERTVLGRERLRYDEIPTHMDLQDDASTAEWQVVPENDTLIEIRLRENRYPCTMIGVDKEGSFYLYAWKGVYSKWPGLTIRQAARELCIKGASNAILCDEGADVFQYLDPGSGLEPIISPGRGQVRAVFVVARPIKEGP